MSLGFENEMVEFKASVSQTSRALESLAAMLNKHGKGKIYFGVDDKGNAIGQEIGNKTIKDLSAAISTRIKPQIIPTINIEVIDDKQVIVVYVEGRNRPYSADGNYLIRTGSENRKMEPDLLRTIMFSNSQEYISLLESFNQELTFNMLRQLYVMNNIPINEKLFLYNLGFVLTNNKYNELANLLSDNNDYSIKVVRFAGTDKTKMIFRNEYGYKCLIYAMNDALNFVNGLNETRVNLDGRIAREEIHLFDSESFREAWLNACLHTNWAKRVPPAIYLFDDRMEIVSTGGLPIELSLDKFYAGFSFPINIQLQKIMGQLGLIEQTGHGVLTIIKNYGKEAFTITDNNVVVTLKFKFPMSAYRNYLDVLTISQRKVYEALKNDPFLKTDSLCLLTGLKSAMVTRIVGQLKQLKKIERIGSNKKGYWKVN